jgi:hypothetical protein
MIVCSTKTITKTKDSGKAEIYCFSDKNSDGTTVPSLFEADLISEEGSEINGVKGKIGELLLSDDDSNNKSNINSNGELIIDLSDDDPQKYGLSNGELIYEQG